MKPNEIIFHPDKLEEFNTMRKKTTAAEELVDRLNRLIDYKVPELIEVFHIDGITRHCPTGDAYDTLCSHGVKIEGDPLIYYETMPEAVYQYEQSLLKYITEKCGGDFQNYILYWRRRPEQNMLIGFNGAKCAITSRLFVGRRVSDDEAAEWKNKIISAGGVF